MKTSIAFSSLPAEVKRAVALRCNGSYGTYDVTKDVGTRGYVSWIDLLKDKGIYTKQLDDHLFSEMFDTYWPLSLKDKVRRAYHNLIWKLSPSFYHYSVYIPMKKKFG